MIIPDPDFYLPGSNNKKRGGEKFFVLTFFVAINFKKMGKNIYFLKR
jgi:hypothetical protein